MPGVVFLRPEIPKEISCPLDKICGKMARPNQGANQTLSGNDRRGRWVVRHNCPTRAADRIRRDEDRAPYRGAMKKTHLFTVWGVFFCF